MGLGTATARSLEMPTELNYLGEKKSLMESGLHTQPLPLSAVSCLGEASGLKTELGSCLWLEVLKVLREIFGEIEHEAPVS